MIIRLARDLHKSLTEIRSLPATELTAWAAVYEIEYELKTGVLLDADPDDISPEASQAAVRSILG